MATKGISSVQPRNSYGFMMLLSYALCEWFLIFMLFLDAGLSYLLIKFAQYCDLQTPCPLCSRLDQVFEKRNSGYYQSLLCRQHAEAISCLVKCSNHDSKLVDVHTLCEDCITSFMKSSRLMLDKIGADATCSCCSKLLRPTTHPKPERFFHLTPVGFGASKADVKPPLPRAPGRSRFSRRNSLKKLRDKIAGPNSPRYGVPATVDSLSHVGYSELKITSESESEVPMSDDGYSTSASCRRGNRKTESIRRKGSRQLLTEVNGGSSEHLPSLLDLSEHNNNNRNSLTRGPSVHHGLGEIDWHNSFANDTTSSSALPELISLDEALKDSSVTVESDTLVNHEPNVSILPELDQLNHGPPSFHAKESSEICKTTEAGILGNENHVESIHEDLFEKSISPEDTDPSTNETFRVGQDELQRSGSVSSDGIEIMQMAAELGMQPFDNGDSIGVKEIEGETVVERLKREVEYYRKCLNALYKELEEERNAAAIAANQAMAMITRLQEEKASLHMEALQYLRMMEEQAEYDMEALEKANELLAEREKEVLDLEAELEMHRFNYLDDPTTDDGSRYEPNNIITNQRTLTNNMAFDFESEKVYISQSLQLLEKKLHQLSTNGNHSEHPENGKEETSPSNPSHVPNSTDLVMENHFGDIIEIDDDMYNFSGQAIDVKIDILRRAITNLQDRLQRLEVDRNILKLALNSLQNGNEGLQFIQEISRQLQELRNYEFALPQ